MATSSIPGGSDARDLCVRLRQRRRPVRFWLIHRLPRPTAEMVVLGKQLRQGKYVCKAAVERSDTMAHVGLNPIDQPRNRGRPCMPSVAKLRCAGSRDHSGRGFDDDR